MSKFPLCVLTGARARMEKVKVCEQTHRRSETFLFYFFPPGFEVLSAEVLQPERFRSGATFQSPSFFSGMLYIHTDSISIEGGMNRRVCIH